MLNDTHHQVQYIFIYYIYSTELDDFNSILFDKQQLPLPDTYISEEDKMNFIIF